MINTALAPLRDDLSPLDLGDVPRGSVTSYLHGAAWNMVDLVDPLLVSDRSGSNQTCDVFKASYWSPTGYNHLGG